MATGVSVAGAESGIPLWARQEWTTACVRARTREVGLYLWCWEFSEEDRRRLGGNLKAACARHGGAVGMWRCLHGVSVRRAEVDVCVRAGLLDAKRGRVLLQHIGEEPADPAAAVAAAIDAGGLVLVEARREAYWQGEWVGGEDGLPGASWDLLWHLARSSKAGAALDEYTYRGAKSKDPKAMTKKKSRLIKEDGFPMSLADLVVLAGRGNYRLNLPPSRIRVFERGIGDSDREWTP